MIVTLQPAVTLDGFIADLSGECYSWVKEDDEARFLEAVEEAGCELVGRKTFDQYREDYTSRTKATTFVVTRDTSLRDFGRVRFVTGKLEQIVSDIAGQGFERLIISGGGDLNGSLAEAGLLDEMRLSVHPVTIGEGIPLFGKYHPKLHTQLVDVNRDVPEVVQLVYKVLK